MKTRYVLILCLFGMVLFVIAMGSVSAWYDSGWSYRKSITIDHDQVEEHLSNFPVLFNITDSTIIDRAQTDFDDLLFTDVNDVKLNHQIEFYDSDNVVVWVNTSSLSASVDTTLYLYYGNPTAGNQENITNVWNSSYYYVAHLNETPANKGKDSTSNSYDGTPTGILDVNGMIDGAGEWNYGVGDKIELPFDFSTGAFTIETYIKTGANVADEQFIYSIEDSSQDIYNFLKVESNSLQAMVFDGVGKYVTATDTIVPYELYHVVYTVEENGVVRLFVNGSFVTQTSIGNIKRYGLANEFNWLGNRNYGAGNDAFDGVIDEFRISSVNQSRGYIKTSYNNVNDDNQTDGGGFWTLGSEEAVVVDVNSSTNIRSTNMVLNGYIAYGQNYSCGFWVGTNASVNHTYNIQNISASGIYESGEIFSTSVTSLTPASVYYIKAWAQNETGLYSSTYTTVLMKPEAPTSVSTVVVNSSSINISWTVGTGANNTVVVRKSGSYPGSISDGSVVGNTTNSYLVVDGISSGSVFYYRLWSYTSRTLADGSFLSQVSDNRTDVVYAFLVVSVFDEATGNALSNWNITVSNSDGSSVYNSSGNNNPLSINTSLLPTGGVSVIVSCNNYEQRVYQMSISTNGFYTLDVYLPKKNVSRLCRIDVVGSQTEYGADPPVEDAFVRVKEFDNESGVYQNVSTFYTDANGQYFLHLDVNTQYIVVVNKSGYNTETSSFIVQDGVQVYTFRLSESTGSSQSWNLFHDVVSLSVSKYSNGSMYVAFVDGGGTTVDTDIFVYEIWNGSLSLNHSDIRSGDSVFGFWVHGLNVYRSHRVVLFFNNTVSFDISSPYSVVVFPFYSAERRSFSFNDRLTNVIGPFMLGDVVVGWHVLISVIVGLMVLAMFGPRNTGIGIIGCGLGIALMDVLFTMWLTDTFPVLLVTLTPLCIVIGIVYLKSQPDGGAML